MKIKIISLIFLTMLCSGCFSTYFRPLGEQSITTLELPINHDFAGVTFVLHDPPIQEIVYLISQSYPQAFVVVTGKTPCYLIYDSNTRGMENSQYYNFPLDDSPRYQQHKALLDGCLIFHDNRLISTNFMPKVLTEESCVWMSWSSMDEEELQKLNEEFFNPGNSIYDIFTLLTWFDVSGLVCLPMGQSDFYLDINLLELKTNEYAHQIKPSKSSSKYYRSGFLWAFLVYPFTDVGGNAVFTSPRFDSSTYANTLNQAFVQLDASIPHAENDYKRKKTFFNSRFSVSGYYVHRREPNVKTTCLISEADSNYLLFWNPDERIENKHEFRELLQSNGDPIDWSKR